MRDSKANPGATIGGPDTTRRPILNAKPPRSRAATVLRHNFAVLSPNIVTFREDLFMRKPGNQEPSEIIPGFMASLWSFLWLRLGRAASSPFHSAVTQARRARRRFSVARMLFQFKVVFAFDFPGGDEQAVGDVGGERFRVDALEGRPHAGNDLAVGKHFQRRGV